MNDNVQYSKIRSQVLSPQEKHKVCVVKNHELLKMHLGFFPFVFNCF